MDIHGIIWTEAQMIYEEDKEMKSKLGLSIGLTGALIYAITYFAGMIPLILIIGYLLIVEKNEWLNYIVIKALCLTILFAILATITSFIPNLLSIVQDFSTTYEVPFYYQLVLAFQSLVLGVLSFVKTILFLLLAVRALGLKDVPFLGISGLVSKHMS